DSRWQTIQDGKPRGFAMVTGDCGADGLDGLYRRRSRPWSAKPRLIASMLGAVGTGRMFKPLLPTALRSLFAAHDLLIDISWKCWLRVLLTIIPRMLLFKSCAQDLTTGTGHHKKAIKLDILASLASPAKE